MRGVIPYINYIVMISNSYSEKTDESGGTAVFTIDCTLWSPFLRLEGRG